MKNVQELRDELADNFKKLKGGEMEVPEAAEMNNTAGKMIKTVMLELKQIDLTGSNEQIPFLGYDNKQESIENESAKQLAN